MASASPPPSLLRRRRRRPTCQLTLSSRRLSLATSPLLRTRILAMLHDAPPILGSGGSGVLVYNRAHVVLEAWVVWTFRAPVALPFNSGFVAKAHGGVHVSRVTFVLRCAFTHNDTHALHYLTYTMGVQPSGRGKRSIHVAVEGLYSMDGTVFSHMFVDEVHITGLPNSRGMAAQLDLENCILVRLSTFGKAIAASSGVCSGCLYVGGTDKQLIRDYLSMTPNAAIIAASCSFDLPDGGTDSIYFGKPLRASLATSSNSPHILFLLAHLRQQPSMAQPPTSIIRFLRPRACVLSAHLLTHGLSARPTT
ncbi:hypothetical protein BJV78DRAFT_1348132 [Lactifluus subvellereus]|nr:hypothetical protein BJV78DRAFT_1348132 [Lactifluus subvellereus]